MTHPLWWLPIFAALCLWLKEAYPFSHFPMYSDPDPEVFYMYVAQGLSYHKPGNPIAISWHSGLRATKVKKRWVAGLKKLKEKGTDPSDQEQSRAVGTALLQSLRQTANKKSRPLPEHLQLISVRIAYENPGFSETHSVVATDEL